MVKNQGGAPTIEKVPQRWSKYIGKLFHRVRETECEREREYNVIIMMKMISKKVIQMWKFDASIIVINMT